MEISALAPAHWEQVHAIYAAGIATGNATFESVPPTWDEFNPSKLNEHRYVAIADQKVLGWVAASAVSDRCVYAGVVEHSVYVDPNSQGQGVGRALLDAFIASTERAGIWTIQSGVFPENAASLALHFSAGFRTVGLRERIGLMTYGPYQGRWRDVVFLERRSDSTGAPLVA